MTILSRRHFTTGALSAPALLTASAEVSLAGGHAVEPPAMFDVPIGRYRMTAIFDGMGQLPKAFFSHPDAAAMEKVLTEAGLKGDTLPAPITAYLLQSDDRTILIDAGMGEVEILGPGFGRLSAALAAAGVAPADVDTVIVTHAHPDHIGGLISGGSAVFPEAELVIAEVEHGFWGDPAMLTAAPEQARGLFQLAQGVFGAYGDRLRLVQPNAEVAPGLRLEAAPGHTPGHSFVHIDGGDRQIVMVADLLHSSVLHTAIPDVGFGFDTDAALAAKTRLRAFDRLSADGALIAATHVPFPGFGRFLRAGDAFRYLPASIG